MFGDWGRADLHIDVYRVDKQFMLKNRILCRSFYFYTLSKNNSLETSIKNLKKQGSNIAISEDFPLHKS